MNNSTTREKPGGRVVIITVLALVLIFGGAYVVAYLNAGDKVPRGASVAGVEIGGLSHDDAVTELEKAYADRDEVDVKVGGDSEAISVEDLGLTLDPDASVDAAGGGKSWSASRLWDYYTGGDDLDAVVDVDEEKFQAVVDRLTKEHGTPPAEGDISFKGGKVRKISSSKGKGIDPGTAREAVLSAWATDETAELELEEIDPEIDDNDVQAALNQFGNPAVSAPVTLVFDGAKVKLTPKEFAPVLDVEASDGKLVPALKEKKLEKLVDSRVTDPDDAPVDATVRLVKGKPKVIPAKPGVDYDPSDITDTFLDLVVQSSGDRTAKVKATAKKADFTTKEARKLGIRRKVSSFATTYPHADYRNVNLGRAAELINGTILKPGETFSLNDTVGERTAENGFTQGFIIAGGVFKEDFGGGVSQMATTLFNAMFFAGLEDVEHRPHSFYIDRYPVGREATVVWGALDLKFKNDTDNGVLVQSEVVPSTYDSVGKVIVTMWSTKTWDITTRKGDRYNFTSESTRTLTTPDCTPNSGYGGFDIDVWRYFHKPGSDKVERTQKFHTTYTPSDTVVCAEPEPEPEPEKPKKPKKNG
ncbi:MAG: VanW family protein [Nocardioides sp.]|nr:VanW family protein [Nocardioides sp.]